MGRIVAIDYGKKRIGLATSDPMGIIASPLGTIEAATKPEVTIERILAAIPECEKIVIGLPLLLSGQDSDTTREVRAFAKLFAEKTSIPIELFDERLTSTEVERRMQEGGLSRKKRAQHTDTLSAVLILQSYLQ